VNADTGKACSDFGQNGEVNLQEFMPYAYPGGYNPTSPGVVTGTTVVIAGSVTDNYSNKEPSGVIRGYDVNTGKLFGYLILVQQIQMQCQVKVQHLFITHQMHGHLCI
jgi:glucose dehydrogenase